MSGSDPAIVVVDEVFLAVPPQTLANCFADPVMCRYAWPDLVLRLHHDRGVEGLRWSVSGALNGSMEVWLEPVLDGTVLHYFLRANPPCSVTGRGRSWCSGRKFAARQRRRRRFAARALAFELKRRLEYRRAPGCAPAPVRDTPADSA